MAVFNPIVRTFYVQVGEDVSTLFDSDIGTILEQVSGVAFKHRHVQTLVCSNIGHFSSRGADI